MRGVTTEVHSIGSRMAFQLTRLMRGVTHLGDFLNFFDVISTHTPHARRDMNNLPAAKLS